MENAADSIHFNLLHGTNPPIEDNKTWIDRIIEISLKYDFILKYFDIYPAPDEHMSKYAIEAKVKLFGFDIAILKSCFDNYGPGQLFGVNHLELNWFTVPIYFTGSIIPISPFKTKIVYQFYSSSNLFYLLFTKLSFKCCLTVNFEDKAIWNNKLFLNKKSFFTQNDELIIKFRRWYQKFYSKKNIDIE